MRLPVAFLAFAACWTASGQTYTISTIAGGSPPATPIAATQASIGSASGVATDSGGNVYFSSDNCVFKIDANGVMKRVAGNSRAGYSGDGGPATSAQLYGPYGVAVDSSGDIYIADNNRIRKVSPAGIITTVAGNGSPGYSGDGGPATSAQLDAPSGVAVYSSGDIYVADYGNSRIRKVSPAGVITTIAGNGFRGYSGDGGPATSAQLYGPSGVAVDSSGDIYIADLANNRIRKVSPAGVITTIAGNGSQGYSGDGGPATSAPLNLPTGVAVDSSGDIYIADNNNNGIRKVSPVGIITTVAGNGFQGYSGDGGPATSAQVNAPYGVAVDSNRDIYIADTLNNRIRKVSPTGIITTVAGNGSQGYSGDGGPATSAQLNQPFGVAVDSNGDIYIADTFNLRIRKISPAGVITTIAGNGSFGYSGDGGPATSAAIDGPYGVAVASSGDIYIADTGNSRIRKVSPAGVITTIAGVSSRGYSGDGGPAASAQLFDPNGVAVDSGGNIYIADTYNYRIRKVSPTGVITTISGNGSQSYSGDGGLATSAPIDGSQGLAVDASGDVYFSDTNNNAVRLLTPSASACSYSLSTNYLQPSATGGTYSLNVTAPAGCAWTISGLPSWITISGASSGSGNGTANFVVAPNTSNLPLSATITVAGIAVAVTQPSGVLLISADGVVSDASYTVPVAPGSIAAIFGNFLLAAPVTVSSLPLQTSLDGLSFQFSGVPAAAPLYYANFGQANAQVPWELAGLTQTIVVASINGQNSAPQSVAVATYAPGIFAVNGSGTGLGAILDASNHTVGTTNPATAGSTVLQIFCTGLGPVTNQPATGAPGPGPPFAMTTTRPIVTIGGAQAAVQYSGLAPGEVGVYQVNALVPAASSKGNSVPVTISIGSVTSNTVTIAVQ